LTPITIASAVHRHRRGGEDVVAKLHRLAHARPLADMKHLAEDREQRAHAFYQRLRA
jgi:hypothetical protein